MTGQEKVTTMVKLFATLREGREKIVHLPWHQHLTPRMILEELKIPEEEVAILLVNGRTGNMDKPLEREDYLSVFPPVGGG